MKDAAYSLWLLPPASDRTHYAALISLLSHRLGTHAFEPHITLSPRFDNSETQAIRTAENIARRLAPVAVQLEAIEQTDAYFRCLFLRAAQTPAILAAHRLACSEVGQEPEDNYLPHVSLVYGTLDRSTKEAIALELANEVPRRFVVGHLGLCHIVGTPNAWPLVATFPLTG